MHFLQTLLRALVFAFLTHVVSGKTVKKTLTVVNANLAPDGFNRSYVERIKYDTSMSLFASYFIEIRTTVVDGMLPGPVITGEIGDSFEVYIHYFV